MFIQWHTWVVFFFFFFQAEDGIRDLIVTGVQTCALPILTLTNSGTATLSITSIALAGLNPGDFAIAAGTTCTNGATVVAGASCLLNLTFTPTTASAQTSTPTMTGDGTRSSPSKSLTGTGVTPPTATLSAT